MKTSLSRKINRFLLGAASAFDIYGNTFRQKPIIRNGSGAQYRAERISGYFTNVGNRINSITNQEIKNVREKEQTKQAH